MLIAGIEVAPPHIVWLADELIAAGNPGTAATLLNADADAHSIELTAGDREALLQVLEDPPEELVELREALLDQDLWQDLV
jgi:hypothetical protein